MGSLTWQPPADVLPDPHAHYMLLEGISEGGQGFVFLAESARQPGKSLAVKFFRADYFGASPAHIEAFIHEALFGRDVRSHHLGHTLELLDLRPWAQEGWPPVALVMEYYGCSLAQVLGQCNGSFKFSASQVARYARELVSGLTDLHGRYRRVHRDVKPGNIMFRLPVGQRYEGPASLGAAEALLTDFGTLAAAGAESPIVVFRDRWKDPLLYPDLQDFQRSLQARSPAAGSDPDPERTVEHRPFADLPHQHCVPAMDVYSFGLVLRELAKITEGDVKWLEDVATDCTHPEPEKRPRAADLFLRLAPDWDEQVQLIREAGLRPEEHGDFEGRTFITDPDGAFEQFAQACGDHGGVFVIEGPPGVGKTALLTNWPERTGQPFGFYFRYRDNRTRAAAMPLAIAEQLCHKFALEFREPANEQDWTATLERLCADIARRADAPQRLLIFVDGLDEADQPTQAVGFIPKALPRGMFIIAATRPPAQGKDHLALLRSAGARIYRLRAEDPNNQKDVQTYLGKQLHDRLAGAEAATLARNTGGIFLLARLVVEAVQQEQLTVADALQQSESWTKLDPSQRLFAYYRESWERICANEDAESLGTFAGLMAAAFTWIIEDQLERILSWYEREMLRRTTRLWTPFRLRAVLRLLTWFLHRRGGGPEGNGVFYQIRHQSVRDYLLSADGPVPPNGLQEIHAAVGRYYRSEAERHGWGRVDPYGRFFAVRHLLAAGDRDSARHAAELLADLDYLQGTLGDVPPDSAAE
jgi:hypothetical protein